MAGLTASQLSWQHLKTIAWLRFRIFRNSMRGKSAMGDLLVNILSYFVLTIIVIGPAIGSGIGSFYIIYTHRYPMIAIVFWAIFLIWQFVGINTTTAGPSFDLATLTRFPIRYRDYLLIRLSFGFFDPSTLAGFGCLTGMCIGVGIANKSLLPWTILTAFLFGVCNIFFSRMIYTWLERWLAQRRTRELVTGFIIAASLGFQLVVQLIEKGSGPEHHHGFSPLVLKAADTFVQINWFLPPGLATISIEKYHSGLIGISLAAFAALLLYTVSFFLCLHARLHAEYMGENLSEAPTQSRSKSAKITKVSVRLVTSQTQQAEGFLSASLKACVIKEFRYLLRSGPKLYALVVPVFMVIVFSFRNSTLSQSELGYSPGGHFLFGYGCLYLQLILVNMLYNAFGSDASGIQAYLLAPIGMRKVVLSKNIVTATVLAIELILIYLAVVFSSSAPMPDLAASVIIWSIFAFLVNLAIGNVRSITSPKRIDPAQVRRQNVSALSAFISLGVTLATSALGAGILAGSYLISGNFWPAALGMLFLSVLGGVAYALVFKQLDTITADNLETFTRELCKG